MNSEFSITTRGGDQGSTQLFSGERVSKASVRLQAYGALDELNSILGLARLACEEAEVREFVLSIQRDLFVVCAELATTSEFLDQLNDRVDEVMLARMDEARDQVEAAITMPKGFVIPAGTPAAAHLDHARTVSRRAERWAVMLQEEGLIENTTVLKWLNRLSDFLWLLARREEGDRMILK